MRFIKYNIPFNCLYKHITRLTFKCMKDKLIAPHLLSINIFLTEYKRKNIKQSLNN